MTAVNDGLTGTELAEFDESFVLGDQATDTISVSGVIGVTDFSATGSKTKNDATADLITVKGSFVGKNVFTLLALQTLEFCDAGRPTTETIYIN